jgi:excinuclease UvrABC helicase subunit UvrB
MNEERGWILGYLEAKGCFSYNKVVTKRRIYQNPAFFLTHKGKETLLLLKEITGLGEVKKAGGLYRWEVRRKKEVIELMELLERGFRTPPKIQQYEKWREDVLQWKQRGRP